MRPKFPRRGPKPVEFKKPPLAPLTTGDFIEIARQSKQLKELRLFWRNAKERGLLTDELRSVINNRAAVLKSEGAQRV